MAIILVAEKQFRWVTGYQQIGFDTQTPRLTGEREEGMILRKPIRQASSKKRPGPNRTTAEATAARVGRLRVGRSMSDLTQSTIALVEL